MINRVRALAERSFPEVKEAKFVEWWAHRRPHSSGHQMHFDSDNEGRGGVRNPIVRCVDAAAVATNYDSCFFRVMMMTTMIMMMLMMSRC